MLQERNLWVDLN